jgi:hypothetical protein
MFETQTKTRLS